jgi:GntP family gluconate:H+ symporter
MRLMEAIDPQYGTTVLLLEVTGGAQVLADTLIGRFGGKRAPLALGAAALIFGFPIFFDAGLVIFLPINFTVARRFGGSLLLYALPAAGAFAAMHAIVPPHPGPVAAATILGGSVGLTLLVGVPVAIVAWYVGVMLVSRVIGRRVDVPLPDIVLGPVNGGRGGAASGPAEHGDDDHPAEAVEAGGARITDRAPSFLTVLGLLLLLVPLVLISFEPSSRPWSRPGCSRRGRRGWTS